MKRFLRWFRPPRRLRILRAGVFTIAGTLALGFATLNTGNNLLYLLLGALLGTIALSGWMSEQSIRDLRIARITPTGAPVGATFRITYHVARSRGWLGSWEVEVRERFARAPHAPVCGTAARIAALGRGETIQARAACTGVARGVHTSEGVTLSTTFPFGMFRKERDIDMSGRFIVWPRTDRTVRVPRVGAIRGSAYTVSSAAARGRGDYRALRPWRGGDERRDIHWKATARSGALVVREYEQDAGDSYWIVLDTVAPDAVAGEVAVEIAAALLIQASRRGDHAGLAAGDVRIDPHSLRNGVEAMMDVLAAVVLTTHGPEPAAPAAPYRCVLVSARGSSGIWGDVFLAQVDSA